MADVLKAETFWFLITKPRKQFKTFLIHINTPDIVVRGVETYLVAIKTRAHIVDVTCNSMSIITSKDSLMAIAATIINSKKELELNQDNMFEYSAYFEQASYMYALF